ncbi:MAG: hypothetical protein WCO26_24545, partial [Deltaproteobacteria bacterium]
MKKKINRGNHQSFNNHREIPAKSGRTSYASRFPQGLDGVRSGLVTHMPTVILTSWINYSGMNS